MKKELDIKNILLISLIALLFSYMGTKLYLYSGNKALMAVMDIVYYVFIVASFVKIFKAMFKDNIKFSNNEVFFMIAGAVYTFSLVLIQEFNDIHSRSLIFSIILILSSIYHIKIKLKV